MRKQTLDEILDLFDVRLDAFSMCGIQDGWSIMVPPLEKVVVHFVLQGEGSVDWDQESLPIGPGSMIIVPANLPKRISGRAPVTNVVPMDDVCPMADGIVQYRGYSEQADLVLGCGTVSASLAGGIELFNLIKQPLVERCPDPSIRSLFDAIARELSRPAAGTRTVISTLMKQILVDLLRRHLRRRRATSPLYLPLMNQQLGSVILAVVAKPQEHHTVEALANTAGMSRSAFTRNFLRSYGRSPMAFVQSVRLRKAAKLLRGTSLPVKSVAIDVGFSSRSHFSRAFSAEFGLDPTAFRQVEEPELESEPYDGDVLEADQGDRARRTEAPAARTISPAQDLSAAEVNNRVRNALARVGSLARRTGRGSASVEEYARNLEKRIRALARTQSLLTAYPSTRLDLRDLANSVLLSKTGRETPIEMSGPDISLTSKEAEVVALALDELAMNSCAEGGLPRAPVKLLWRVADEGGQAWLALRWEEPAGQLHHDFGRELITRRVPYELDGRGSVQLNRHGFQARIEFPLAFVPETIGRTYELRQAPATEQRR